MADSLNVRDVRLARREVQSRRGGTRDKIETTVTVKNTSERETVYVSVSLRYIAFDEARRELTLSTAEQGKLPFRIHNFMLPTIVAVEPGRMIPVRLQVPVKLVEIKGVKDRRLVTEARDLSAVSRVRVQIGFAPTAFRPIPKQAPEEVREQLLEWQHVVENTFERSLPAGGKDDDQGKREKRKK